MQVSTTPLHPFCASSISTSMNTVCVKKTQVVEVQITLQEGHNLVNYDEIHENKKLFRIITHCNFDQRQTEQFLVIYPNDRRKYLFVVPLSSESSAAILMVIYRPVNMYIYKRNFNLYSFFTVAN